ncbi:hypothetical protein M501DRAFT_1013261 [Patellaria atrata CBS 101060]|uniref:Hydrophobin n=1 Tax=Patellaria atrata CBS 101060 TaxID=1346257 RepID=A0A9P4SFE6_9PEZI|nr:hypothetical protein M501DRAFT_1013261 [Patellaria atrata CBS 101060]
MKTSAIFSISFAILAAAAPSKRTTPKTIGGASEMCSPDQTLSCCNPSSEDYSAGLISAIVGPVLANSCVGVGANVVSVLTNVAPESLCGSTEVSCCTGNKNSGLIVVDAQCSSL